MTKEQVLALLLHTAQASRGGAGGGLVASRGPCRRAGFTVAGLLSSAGACLPVAPAPSAGAGASGRLTPAAVWRD